MNEELAMLTIGYLVGYYKTHDETTINKDEIDAINFIIEKNETLQQELQKYKSLYENEKDHTDTLKRIIKKIEYVVVNEELGETIDGKPYYLVNDLIGEEILDLLKEIK